MASLEEVAPGNGSRRVIGVVPLEEVDTPRCAKIRVGQRLHPLTLWSIRHEST
jgi:hypothetical protein